MSTSLTICAVYSHPTCHLLGQLPCDAEKIQLYIAEAAHTTSGPSLDCIRWLSPDGGFVSVQ